MSDEVSGAFPPFCGRKTGADPPRIKTREEGEAHPPQEAETSASEVQLQ